MITEEIRSYEVSLWTLQDEFITVLKWSDVEQQGRILNPKMTLNVDGTEKFTFMIPMYLEILEEGDRNAPSLSAASRMRRIENPIWYNTRNGNLIASMRKIKVIFNKFEENAAVYEFLITKVTEEHTSEQLTCKVECEGLAFHELGKIGYKIALSLDTYELDKKDYDETGHWVKRDGTICNTEPLENVQYWCELCNLIELTDEITHVNPTRWYYKIDMNWDSYSYGVTREKNIVYEEEYVPTWSDTLIPGAPESKREKCRPISIEESNIYNITLTIAETFGIYCRYEYGHDDNNQINSRTIIFYNNYIKDKDNIISLTYPYSSNSISREMDSTDIVTKMYVQPQDTDLLMGQISIADCEANKTKEDYLLNFDYMRTVGAITEEQYEDIGKFELDIRILNQRLIRTSLELEQLNKDKLDADTNVTFYDVARKESEELLSNANLLYNRLDESDGIGDGYFSRTATNPYSTYVRIDTTDNSNLHYILTNEEDKGIVHSNPNLIQIYTTYNSATATLSNNIANNSFTVVVDEFNDIYRINLPSNISGIVYLTYKYRPKLYYDAVQKAYVERHNSDEDNYVYWLELLTILEASIEEKTLLYKLLIGEKNECIAAFERMLGPALREGYWLPEDYLDHGDNKSVELTVTGTYNADILIADTNKNAVFGWDNDLFDTEDKLYYEEGINLTKHYYPCIKLTNTNLLNFIKKWVKDNKTISFLFNNNYYKTLTGTEDLQIENLTIYTIGSNAKLGFIKLILNNNTVIPVIILTGSKSLTDSEINFMLNSTKGKPRIGLISINVDLNNNVALSIEKDNGVDLIYSITSEDIYWGDAYEIVYPRIKISSLELNPTSVTLSYDSKVLTNYVDYSIVTRSTNRINTSGNGEAHMEHFITIKPEVFFKSTTLFTVANINYTLSNAATAIFLDAMLIMNENSIPKVSYTIKISLFNPEYIQVLYSMLTQLVMINDYELKFENVFGYISQVELDLDLPQNDTIEVKNYKTKFEDLFSTIVAQSEDMKRNSASFNAAINGSIALNDAAFAATLENNTPTLYNYLDIYLSESATLDDKLNALFNEAGEILSSANTSLNSVRLLSIENASILSDFASKVTGELIPRVYNSSSLPTIFKVGDIWNKVDSSNNVIARYIAVSDSNDSASGWTRTYDGRIAAISGASLDVDSVSGNINILAKNTINITGDNVDIVGNKEVNIGGAKINICSVTSGSSTYLPAGINLIAGAYNTTNLLNSNIAKVLISPSKIEMGAAELMLKASSKMNFITSLGSTTSTSAISLDVNNGIWIGSGKGVRFYSGDVTVNSSTGAVTTATSGASVEINSTHLLLGVANLSSGSASALEMTPTLMLLAVGTTVSSGSTTQITTTTNVSGILIQKDYIGLAAGTASSSAARSLVSIKPNFVLIGSATGSNISESSFGTGSGQSGAYVSISSSGVVIGSAGTLTVSTTNFKVTPGATSTNAMFYVGSGGESASDKYIKYSATNGLEVRGAITATALSIVTNGSTQTLSDFVNSAISGAQLNVTDELIWAGVKRATSATSLQLNDSYVKFTVTNNNATTTAFLLDSNGVTMSGKNITMTGAHILINGEQEWSRDDIIVMSSNSNHWSYDIANVEKYMKGQTVTINGHSYTRSSAATNDWVVIKPYYTINRAYQDASSNNTDGYKTYSEIDYNSPTLTIIPVNGGYNAVDYLGTDSETTYTYELEFDAMINHGESYITPAVKRAYIGLKAGTGNGTVTASYIYSALSGYTTTPIDAIFENFTQINYATNGTQHCKCTIRSSTNLCSENHSNNLLVYVAIYTAVYENDPQEYNRTYIYNVTLNVSTGGTTGKRVPCNVYYYQAGAV